MRRKDREVTDRADILNIMDACAVASLALMDSDWPYVIHLNFGYVDENEKLSLYFHGAREGKKLELIQKNAHAAFSMSCDHLYVPGASACSATYRYASVCGRGKISVVDGPEKSAGLAALMAHYEPGRVCTFEQKLLDAVCVLKLEVEVITGKRKALK